MRAISVLLLPAAGVVLGVVLVEVALRFAALRPLRLVAAGQHWRTHYIDNQIGVGKCYPSDPSDYFPNDLRSDEGMRSLGDFIAEVSDLPDEMTRDERVEHLRRHAPFCTNTPLEPLNAGVDRERPLQALIIGDSFAFGEGLRLEDTIGYRLADHYPSINFRNMSWPGVSVKTLFDVEAVGDEIDAVLYFYNLNDLLRTEELQARRLRLHEASFEARRQPDVVHVGPLERLCGRLRLCQLVRLHQSETRQTRATIDYYHDIYFGAENEGPRQASFERIGEMQRILEERGIRFVVVVFPLFYRPPLSGYPLGRIHARVVEELGARGVEVLDLLPAYERHRFWDKFLVHPLDRHPSAEAIEVAARYLRDHFEMEEAIARR